MPVSPNDMERLLRAINANTAAILTAAVVVAHKGKPASQPSQGEKTIIEGIFQGFCLSTREDK